MVAFNEPKKILSGLIKWIKRDDAAVKLNRVEEYNFNLDKLTERRGIIEVIRVDLLYVSGTNCSTSRTSDARVPWYARSSLSFWMEELFHAWNCVRYAVEPGSRVFFTLIYLYFGYEHGDTRNFNDTALEISNYRN